MDRSAFTLASWRLCVHKFLVKAQSRKVRALLKQSRRRALLRFTITIFALSLISLTVFFVHSYHSYAKIVDARLARGYLTSRAGIYAAPHTLRAGQKLSRTGLAATLRRAGYVESEDAGEVWNGSFSLRDDSVEIRPNNTSGYPSIVRVTFDHDARIAQLTGDDTTLDVFTLAPESLTTAAAMKSGARTQL